MASTLADRARAQRDEARVEWWRAAMDADAMAARVAQVEVVIRSHPLQGWTP